MYASYYYRRSSVACVYVCLLVTSVSPAKTVEPMELRFRGFAGVGPQNHY